MSDMDAASTPDTNALTTLLQLEADARSAESLSALQFLIANETRRLIPYRQAFLFSRRARGYRLETASSVAVIARDAPFVTWIEKVVNSTVTDTPTASSLQLRASDVPASHRASWSEYSLPFVLWCHLRSPNGQTVGGIWLGSEKPWSESSITLCDRLSVTYAHAWLGLIGRTGLRRQRSDRRYYVWLALLLLVGAMFVPVRLSTLAPAAVVAKDPVVISAPINGVISTIEPDPNSWVESGAAVLEFDRTELRNKYRIKEEAYQVTVAEFRQASQSAFADADSKASIALLRAQVALSKAERDYSRELLEQSVVVSPRAGLLLYSNRSEWIGRPVVVGERIMELADPGSTEIRIDLPVSDAIALTIGSPVKLFLDADPIHPIAARVSHASYEAEPIASDALVYHVRAQFEPGEEPSRIGLQGTAKIYGSDVSLFFYIFRKPLAAFRQFTGL